MGIDQLIPTFEFRAALFYGIAAMTPQIQPTPVRDLGCMPFHNPRDSFKQQLYKGTPYQTDVVHGDDHKTADL